MENRRMTPKARRRETIVICIELALKMALVLFIMLALFALPELLCKLAGVG